MNNQQRLKIKSKFYWLTLVTSMILLIPLIAMQYTNEVNWDKFDFILMAALCMGIGSAFIILSHIFKTHSTKIAIALILVFLIIWAELAVGVFTN